MAEFRKTLTDPSNPIGVHQGVVDTSTAELVGKAGAMGLEAHAGYRAAELDKAMRKEIDLYAGYDEKANTMVENYSKQNSMLLDQSEDFAGDGFFDPAISDNNQQFASRAMALKQAHEGGAMSRGELDLRLEAILRDHIGRMPGLGPQLRRTYSEIIGDNKYRLEPYRVAEEEAAKLQYARAKAEQDLQIEADKLGITVEQLKDYYHKQHLLAVNKQSAQSFQDSFNATRASIGLTVNAEIHKAFIAAKSDAAYKPGQALAVRDTIINAYENAIVQVQHDALQYPGSDPQKYIEELRKDRDHMIETMEKASAAGRAEELMSTQSTLQKHGLFAEFGVLYEAMLRDPDAAKFLQDALVERENIFNSNLSGEALQARRDRWTRNYGVYARVLWPNDNWSSKSPTNSQPGQAELAKAAEEQFNSSRNKLDIVRDKAKEPEQKMDALDTLLSRMDQNDLDLSKAVIEDPKIAAEIIANPAMNAKLKQHTVAELAKTIAAVNDMSPTIATLMGTGGKKISQQLYDYLAVLEDMVRTYGPSWNIDPDNFLEEQLFLHTDMSDKQLDNVGKKNVHKSGQATRGSRGESRWPDFINEGNKRTQSSARQAPPKKKPLPEDYRTADDAARSFLKSIGIERWEFDPITGQRILSDEDRNRAGAAIEEYYMSDEERGRAGVKVEEGMPKK